MDAQERRQAIARRLERARSPVSAPALAREFSVSRQIIVGDVAILRAGGQGITATPRGYMVQNAPSGLVRQIAVKHDGQAMEAELNAMVDQGCTVLDVIVDHPIYGQLTAPAIRPVSGGAVHRPMPESGRCPPFPAHRGDPPSHPGLPGPGGL